MKSLVEILEAKKYNLNNTEVQKGQKIEVKHWRDGDSNYIVTYYKPHESSSFFYAIEADGSVKAIKNDRIVKILDPEKKQKKLSRAQAEKLSDELYELRRKVRNVNYDMDEELPGLGEEAYNGNNPIVKRYAEQLDKLYDRIAEIEKRLNNSGW